MLVIDASAILELLLRTTAATEVEERILSANGNLHAPHLLDIEVAHVLRRYCAAGEMTPHRVREAFVDLKKLTIVRYAHWPFIDRIWELRNNVTAYDAAYLVLAEFLSVPFLTCDGHLRSAPGHQANVEVVE